MYLFRTFRGGGAWPHDTNVLFPMRTRQRVKRTHQRVVAEEHANVLKKYVNLLLLRVGHVTRPYMVNSAYYPS